MTDAVGRVASAVGDDGFHVCTEAAKPGGGVEVSALDIGQTAVAVPATQGHGRFEFPSIPELPKLLDIEGCIVTLDAMGTQTKSARCRRSCHDLS